MKLRCVKLFGRAPGVGHYRGKGILVRCLLVLLLLYFLINTASSRNENNKMTFYCVNRYVNAIRQTHIKSFFFSKRAVPPHVILDRNVAFINKLTIIFCASLTELWLYSFLLCCGDIETNPGPSSGSNTSSVSLSSTSSLTSLPCDVCHLNIQSLLPKIDHGIMVK